MIIHALPRVVPAYAAATLLATSGALTAVSGASGNATFVQPQAALNKTFLPIVAKPGDTSSPTLSAPSDQDLIAEALTAGRLDYGTSLLYRAYALFGDDRLPRAFWGAAGGNDEDSSLFREANDAMLPPAITQQLRPFLVRPAQPDSVFNQPRPSATAGITSAAETAPCAAGWASQTSTVVPLKEGACKTGSYAADLAQALALVTPIYQAETQLMGPVLATAYIRSRTAPSSTRSPIPAYTPP